ncbi:MAG: hypothetical protein AUK55_10235 [Syntrophobacteraceae bacterium CG2_30_61_12]|nr:MAG: hypothetical protein AUK55_10235 [Syntrophobacteraceae bacterium CG2_30_61_12]
MNLYDEFFLLVRRLNELEIRYAVVGGIALAFHGKARFTRDLDLLVRHEDFDPLAMALSRLGYEETAEPWVLPDTPLTLHRFLKVDGEDELMVDILVAADADHHRVIGNADLADSEVGPVPIATRIDLIRMKRSRNSAQDRVDISALEENDKTGENSTDRE